MNDTCYDSQLFAELYDLHPQAIVWMRPIWGEDDTSITDFEFTYCNEEGLRYLNLTREQQRGLKISNTPTLSDPLRMQVLEEMTRVYQSGEKSETNIYNSALNKYARVLRTRLRDGVLTVVQDRTEEQVIIRQLDEKTRQLEEQKNLLDNIMKNSSNGISVSQVFRDESGKIVDALTILANDAAVRYIGLPKEIYLTKRATEIEPAVLNSPYYQMCIKTLETGEPFVTQYQMQSTGRWLELTVSKLDYDHLIQVFTDVTPIKEAQLKLEKSLEELRRTNTELEEFAYVASHDLQEPLRKVNTFVDRLKLEVSQQLNEKQLRNIERIEAATSRMKDLIEDLLAYAQLSNTRDAFQQVSLNEVVQKAVQDLETSISETGAMIQAGKLPEIKGSERQLRQMFQNLIGNAIKYRKGNVLPQVSITCNSLQGSDPSLKNLALDLAASYYLIEVLDNGIGFEQQYADSIFQMFQRLHGRAEYEGTGIGLSIVRKVVDNHKGYIWAESEPGKGSAFKILLPV